MKSNNTTWKIVEGDLVSKWAGDVNPEDTHPEYPRPQMTRENWQNLNGLWDYAIVDKQLSTVTEFEGKILVPFVVESALSGVKRTLLPTQQLWYRRYFELDQDWDGQRILLHFGGVDYQTNLWVNGQYVGDHIGGNLPFWFDITEFVTVDAKNEILLSVWDPTNKGKQERGKQVLKPGGIWYTAASGIWQTVWIEPVPQTSIKSLRLTPDIDAQTLAVESKLSSSNAAEHTLQAKATLNGEVIAQNTGPANQKLVLSIASPALWSPDTPTLHDLEVNLLQDKKLVDHVRSYFGMRKFHVAPDKTGIQRIYLNHQPLFHYGPLDQGYWPDGLYTAPTEEAMLFDIQYAKDIGCNMIRKHIKVEPARWYHHCDKLGIIVWQDMPNGGKATGSLMSLIAMKFHIKIDDRKLPGRAGRKDAQNRENFKTELLQMLDWLHNFPSIGLWVPFNEGWGQFNATEIAEMVKRHDPTRPVDHASGWFDQETGDFQSIHIYFSKLSQPKPDPKRAFILSEFGGYSLMVEDHLWVQNKKFGYRFYNTKEELTAAYIALLQEQLFPLIPTGLSGAVYTQTTDVEMEINGYVTYDREIEKMDRAALVDVHQKLYKYGKQ